MSIQHSKQLTLLLGKVSLLDRPSCRTLIELNKLLAILLTPYPLATFYSNKIKIIRNFQNIRNRIRSYHAQIRFTFKLH